MPPDDTHEFPSNSTIMNHTDTPSRESPSNQRPSVNHSPKARAHPYDKATRHRQRHTDASSSNGEARDHSPKPLHPHNRMARNHPDNTFPRPDVFGAHTLLCGTKLSNTLMAERPPPKVDEYPLAPDLKAYDTRGALVDREAAEAALELARAAHLTLQMHESMIQAKIQEELVVLRILQRKAESIASASRDGERQIGELTGMLRDQEIFFHKRVGEPVDSSEDEYNDGDEEHNDGDEEPNDAEELEEPNDADEEPNDAKEFQGVVSVEPTTFASVPANSLDIESKDTPVNSQGVESKGE